MKRLAVCLLLVLPGLASADEITLKDGERIEGLIVEATDDGAVVLRPAAVYPIELYSDARVKGFEQANRLTAAESARIAAAIKRPRAGKRTKA